MAFDGRRNIIEINEQERTVYFETWKNKKITGAKIGAMLGYSEHTTPFKVACELAGLYPGDRPNKYIDAGNTLEPVLRNYLGRSATAMLGERLGVPEGTQLAVERLTLRRSCPDCNSVFHLRFNPPAEEGVCDKCGGRLYQRDDDTEATVKNRLKVYRENTFPLIEYYRRKGILTTIEGKGSINEIFQKVEKAIQ